MGHAGRSGSESTNDRRPVALAKVRVPEIRALRLVRLEGRLASVWDRRLGVVVAPAGSGKTTLLAGFAASADAAVAWYRAETWDARPEVMLRHLHSAFAAALRGATADSWDETELAEDESWSAPVLSDLPRMYPSSRRRSPATHHTMSLWGSERSRRQLPTVAERTKCAGSVTEPSLTN